MRVALFSEVFPPKIDGISNRLQQTVSCMRRTGQEVLVFAPTGAVEELAGARVVTLPGLPFPVYPELRVTAPHPRIAYELMRFRPEVVHAVGPVCLGVWGMLTARALRLPIVASYHTDLPRYMELLGLGAARPVAWPLIRAVHNLAQLNLVPSRHTREELDAHGVRNVELWRGGVDTELFHPRRRSHAMRMRLTNGQLDRPILLYVGRLSREKNIDSLVGLLDAMPGATLAVVGDGPDRARLERSFDGRATCFTGFLRGEELAQAYASADVFVMPSTTETLGFVVLEAMSSGCPVVAARAGGIPDLVTHRENGLLYDPDRPAQLRGHVATLLADRGRARFLAEQARKRAKSCSWERSTRELRWSYRRAIHAWRQRSLINRVRNAFA